MDLSLLSPASFYRCRGPNWYAVRSEQGRLCSLRFAFFPHLVPLHCQGELVQKGEYSLFSTLCVWLCQVEFQVQMLTTWADQIRKWERRLGYECDRQGGTLELRTYMSKARSKQQYWLTRSPKFPVFVLALQMILILNHNTRVRSSLLF